MPYDDFSSSGTNNLDELNKHNSYGTLLVLPTGGDERLPKNY